MDTQHSQQAAQSAASEVSVATPAIVDNEMAFAWLAMASDDPKARQEARNVLITHYATLVTHVATRMIGRLPDTVELADLVSYGMFGLIDAVERFEPERGIKFETYASTRVRGAIIDELRAADWVPRSVRSRARAVETTARELEQELQRPITDTDVANALEWEPCEVRTVRAQVALSHIAALDVLGADSDALNSPTLGGLTMPGVGQSLEVRETHALLSNAIQNVRDREQQVLHLYYYENLTLAQIGQILGVTESRVSQIHSAAVKKLRESLVESGAFA